MLRSFFKYLSICVIFASCTYPKSDSTKVATAIVGGKTDEESAKFDPFEKTRFDSIASHVVLITLDEITPATATSPATRQAKYSATGVIVDEQIILTAAHTFEEWKFDATHVGSIYFGSSGDYRTRPRQEFAADHILNRTPKQIADLATVDWSNQPGNLDYVLLRPPEKLPVGFNKITLLPAFFQFKTGDHFRAAGFGLSDPDPSVAKTDKAPELKQDFQLRTLELTLSRSSLEQASEKFWMATKDLEPGVKKYFLEFDALPSATVQHGDSGGPYYSEEVDELGQLRTYLAGIVISHRDNGEGYYSDYALRVDAFYNDVKDTALKLKAASAGEISTSKIDQLK